MRMTVAFFKPPSHGLSITCFDIAIHFKTVAQKPHIYRVISCSFRYLLGVQLCLLLYRKLRPNIGILLRPSTGEISVDDVIYVGSSCALKLLLEYFLQLMKIYCLLLEI